MKLSKLLLLCSFFMVVSVSTNVSAYESFGSEQSACFAAAMVGMDSVINSRLGVPAEHALELSDMSQQGVAVEGERFDINLLKVILGAYLWKESPHTYAVHVFYQCAQTEARLSRHSAGLNQ